MKNLKIFASIVEDEAINQINTLLEQEAFKDCKVRIMPDVHAGKGCVIGFTANLGKKVIPNLVGVDIGCGMAMVCLGKINLKLEKLDQFIRENIPSGMNVREKPLETLMKLKNLKCYKQLKNKDNYLEKSMGTLGGGNHFIEVDEDNNGNLYLIVHTGSRNLGKQVCEIYQEKAIKHCSYENELKEEKSKIIKYLKELGKETLISEILKAIDLKYKDKTKLPKDLCYLEGKDREDYLHDMKICQEWASENRANILQDICSFIGYDFILYDETRHNYIDNKNIVRKGAISAHKGEEVLIPINMRDGCIIGIGKGNEDWNCSAPHGAGRLMSRAEAKKKISMEEYLGNMAGVYTTSVCVETLDESPMAYKPIESIIENIKDTVEIKEIIKPIYNFKANS